MDQFFVIICQHSKCLSIGSFYLKLHCKPKPCKAYRELPVSQFSQGKPVSLLGTPVLITGISL